MTPKELSYPEFLDKVVVLQNKNHTETFIVSGEPSILRLVV